jgi:type I restriction enzyme M protein
MSWKETVQDILDKEKNKIVTINLEKETVDYSDQIKKHENPKIIGGDEEVVRAYLVNRLANQLDYKPEDIEIEKRYEISLGRKTKEHKAENDVILRDPKGNAFYLIETKSPKEFESGKKTIIGQLFGISREEARKCEVKYLCYYSLDEIDGGVKDKAIIIDFDKFKEYDDWVDAGEPSVGNELSPGYDKPKKQPYIKGDLEHDLITSINRDEISSLSSNLHNVLWGGGGTSDTEIFYSLVNIILAKIQDESEKEEDQEYDFQIYAYGDNIENAEKVFDRINNLYKRALKEKLNITNKLELQEARVIDRNKFPLNKLVYTVQSLEKYSFIEGRSSLDGRDILGDFFENITRDGFKQTKGQFFTPTPIIRFMLYALQLDELALNKLNTELELPFIIDPSVGSGSFLIEAMKVITKEIKYKQWGKVKTSYQVKERFDDFFMPDHKENRWAEKFLYGTDINFDLGTASKVNMILHGDGSSNIFVKDGLLPFKFYTKDKTTSSLQVSEPEELYGNKEVNEEFDVVISNPPFSVNLDNETKRYLDRSFIFGDKKNSENLFIERWYQVLKENGRLAVVLPESVFDTTENKYIRIFIFKYFKVKAVVSLPQLTFEPFTSTKTSLLFAQKKPRKEVIAWNKQWEQFGKEWAELKTRVQNYVKVIIEGEDAKKFPSIKGHKEAEIKKNILRYLKDYTVKADEKSTSKELLEKYKDEVEEVSKYDNDTKDVFGYYNVWWVFGEVAKSLEYSIFMAEAENVGYKRTKRGEKAMLNDLFDLEIAPTFLNKKEIMDTYQERLDHYANRKKELAKELENAKSKKNGKAPKNIDKVIEQLEREIEASSLHTERLTKEKSEIDKIIETYYTKTAKVYTIKDEYFDRTDPKLLAHFINGLLQGKRSDDTLLRKKEKIKILDIIRKEVTWL